MGRRLQGWRALRWGDRLRLLACMAGLAMVHTSLAAFGYHRTRRWIEAITKRTRTRAPSREDLDRARALARLATIAGNQAGLAGPCLRQSLLLLGWLRLRGLQPMLHLGIREQTAPSESLPAHAWIELEGTRLREADAGYRSFFIPP